MCLARDETNSPGRCVSNGLDKPRPAFAGSSASWLMGSVPAETGCSCLLRLHGWWPTSQRLRPSKLIEVSWHAHESGLVSIGGRSASTFTPLGPLVRHRGSPSSGLILYRWLPRFGHDAVGRNDCRKSPESTGHALRRCTASLLISGARKKS